MFDVIERLKSEWTDKFVVINRPAPELARFANATGVVRTVNMNGRCLVEFDQHNNIGWYDIDPVFLRVVPEPQPKPAVTKTTVTKTTVKSSPSPQSTAEKSSAKTAPAKPAAKTSDKPAGNRPSTADILALARGKKAATAPASSASAPAPLETSPEPKERESVSTAAETAIPSSKPVEKPAKSPVKLSTTAEKISWCRANDGK
ncbi:MAG: hypothetical protein ACKOCN_00115 [Planctomycetaceae bacterium]